MFRLALVSLVALSACTGAEAPKLHGQVVDVWGQPIEGATIVVEGLDDRPTTDNTGSFTMPMREGTVKIKAGLDGYIQEHTEIEVTDPENPPTANLTLYPKPEKAGFFVVGPGSYKKLEPVAVTAKGTELEAEYGMKEISGVRIEAPLRVVFHTDFDFDEVMRLDLTLHHLDYTKETELQGPVGQQKAEINMYTPTDAIELDIQPMRSRTDYLVVPKAELEPGAYAFHTQGVLTPKDQESFSKIPDNLRVAFPFELR